jgi:hypothetical protein
VSKRRLKRDEFFEKGNIHPSTTTHGKSIFLEKTLSVHRRPVLQGTTAHFHVYYDPRLGQAGKDIAKGVTNKCESDYNHISKLFGRITPRGMPFKIVISALPEGGAFHYGCSAVTLFCDAKTTPPDSDYSSFLVVAEGVEVFEAAQGGAFNCGASDGEGLSRVLATELYPAQLTEAFTTAPDWLDSRRPNFVDHTDPTDTNPVSTGCAVLFLYYLRFQLRHSWKDIIAKAGSTLGETYRNLTGSSNGFSEFNALIETHFPKGKSSGLTKDNPFPLR